MYHPDRGRSVDSMLANKFLMVVGVVSTITMRQIQPGIQYRESSGKLCEPWLKLLRVATGHSSLFNASEELE